MRCPIPRRTPRPCGGSPRRTCRRGWMACATWRASALARRGVPTYLAVECQRSAGPSRQLKSKVGWAGEEQVLLAPTSGASGCRGASAIAEVLILPLAPLPSPPSRSARSARIFAPTFGLLVGWRSFRRLVVLSARSGRRRVDAGRTIPSQSLCRGGSDQPIAPWCVPRSRCCGQHRSLPAPRSVLLDVGLILGTAVAATSSGAGCSSPDVSGSRIAGRASRCGTDGVFIVPVIVYTLLSIVRLQRIARRQHEGELAAMVDRHRCWCHHSSTRRDSGRFAAPRRTACGDRHLSAGPPDQRAFVMSPFGLVHRSSAEPGRDRRVCRRRRCRARFRTRRCGSA